MPRIVITAALLLEARAIARAFRLCDKFHDHVELGSEVVVVLVGPGGRYLDIIRQLAPQALIMAGLAGALSPDLGVGDVVAQGDLPGSFPGLKHRLFRGRLATTEQIISTPAEKAALFREIGALAVDMETQHAQILAKSMRIPFLAVRAISDAATDTLDPALLALVDTDGKPRMTRVLLHLAGHPTKLRQLLRIRQASNLALSHMTATLQALVADGWPKSI